jgi:hypothetical protein
MLTGLKTLIRFQWWAFVSKVITIQSTYQLFGLQRRTRKVEHVLHKETKVGSELLGFRTLSIVRYSKN